MFYTRAFFKGFAALMILLGTAAFAQTTGTQSATTTVTASNILSVTAGGSLTFTPTVGSPDQDASTSLSFESNDGETHRITVVADTGGWTFAPSVTGNVANTYPVLRFVSATATAGSASLTAGELISSANALGAAVDVVTGITNVSGTAAVTLEASITQTVVAGSYAAGLTYTLVTP